MVFYFLFTFFSCIFSLFQRVGRPSLATHFPILSNVKIDLLVITDSLLWRWHLLAIVLYRAAGVILLYVNIIFSLFKKTYHFMMPQVELKDGPQEQFTHEMEPFLRDKGW